MKKTDVEDYLQEGIYGKKEINPSERRQYLGTLRERVILALTKAQVMQEEGIQELAGEMKAYKEAKLLLNGEVSYRFLSPYKDMAEQEGIHHTTISNQDSETELGAVLTLEYAVDKHDVFLDKQEEPPEHNQEKGILDFFQSLFKEKR
ncbi:YueI family protein [Halobacillus litoralis]|uniref:YueI family protein n=1 Tax=Halobacillus litoralis TaxID=45668 RepID=UPI001CFF4CB0|nr:YueI family protein [Halobacillus litoralis]